MKISTSKPLTRIVCCFLAIALFVLSISSLFAIRIVVDGANAPESSVPILVEDFENRMVVNKFNPTSEYSGFYSNESKLSGGLYWQRSSWAVITSDANPKYSDSSYNRDSYNEYLKMTYLYEGMDMSNIERPIPTDGDAKYQKSERVDWYKDYAFNAAFVLPNDSKKPTTVFYGDAGKEYTVYIDVALVEDDNKKVEFYASPTKYTEGNTYLMDPSAYRPSEANGDILICSTEVTGDKKLQLQSKYSYTFKTYKFTYKAVAGTTPVILMVTNNGNTINATSTKKDFACAYVDNVKVYLEGKYFKSVSPTASELNVKYEDGQKLSDVNISLEGYKDDGLWYDDYDCKILSTDEYPVGNKTYYRKWTKHICVDFESEYRAGTSIFYKDPLDEKYGDYSKYYVRSDVARRVNRDGNYVAQMTYCLDNPVYRTYYGNLGEYFDDYKDSPFLYIFDTGSSSKFTGSPGFKYKISFDYEIEGPLPEEDVSFYLYLTKNSLADHDAVVKGLTEANGSILCGKFDVVVAQGSKGRTAELEFSAKMGYAPRIVMVTNGGNKAEIKPTSFFSAYIDNIELTEEIPEGSTVIPISFDSNGGSSVSGFRVLKGYPIGALPTPTRTGYLFDCWYLDGDSNQSEVYQSVIVNEAMHLKAKWVEVKATNYQNSELDKFTTIRYQNVLDNYIDLDFSTLLDNGIASSVTTAANRYIKQGCPNNMGSALLLSNKPFAMSNAKSGISALALLNADGTKFAVKKGTRYKVEFDYLPLGESNAHTYIRMVYGSYTADTIDASSGLKGIFNVPAHGMASDTQSVTQYFSAAQDGFVFFTLGSRQNFDSTPREHFVLLDNIRITIQSNVKSVTFENADGSSISVNPFGYNIQYGLPGDEVREFGINAINGKQIEGFYNDKDCTQRCTDYNVFTNYDRKIYVKYKGVDYKATSDFTEPITLDFENSGQLDLGTMYRYIPYMSYQSTEKENALEYIENDPENAFDGTGYMRIRDVKYIYSTAGSSFVLYDKNNPSGIMMFEPNTSYRITAQVKYEDDAKAPILRFWWADMNTNKWTAYNDANLTTTNDDIMGYTEVSSVFTTKDKPTAVALGAYYLNELDVYIDNIKVEKMNYYTIKFETNGGDKIDDLVVLPYTDLASMSPGFAFKPGYEFVGWYLDSKFTKPFDFLKDYITGNITLYAKYILEPEEKEDTDTEDNKTVDTDEESLNEDSPKFGNQLEFEEADSVVKTENKIVNKEPISVWFIVIASFAALVVVGGVVTALWFVRNRKQ